MQIDNAHLAQEKNLFIACAVEEQLNDYRKAVKDSELTDDQWAEQYHSYDEFESAFSLEEFIEMRRDWASDRLRKPLVDLDRAEERGLTLWRAQSCHG